MHADFTLKCSRSFAAWEFPRTLPTQLMLHFSYAALLSHPLDPQPLILREICSARDLPFSGHVFVNA